MNRTSISLALAIITVVAIMALSPGFNFDRSTHAQDNSAAMAALESRIAELERLVALQQQTIDTLVASSGQVFPPPLEMGIDIVQLGNFYQYSIPIEMHLTLVCGQPRETSLGSNLILDCGWLPDYLQYP